MQNLEMVFKECHKISVILMEVYPDKKLTFDTASMSTYEIIFRIDTNTLIFNYFPERYEPEGVMFYKGLQVKFGFNVSIKYSVKRLLSFFENDCKLFMDDYRTQTIRESLESFDKLLSYIQLNEHQNWEEMYKIYIEKNYTWPYGKKA